MPKMKLNVEELNVTTFGTEPLGAEASEDVGAGVLSYTRHISYCQQTGCC